MTPERALKSLQSRYASQMDHLSSQLSRGDITAKDYIRLGRTLIREAHERADYLGQVKAGVRKPFGAVNREVGQRIAAAEADFLKGFRDDLDNGRYKRKNQGGQGAAARKARAWLYAKKLAGTANEAWARNVLVLRERPKGETRASVMARWVLADAEHCEDCIAEAAKGERPLSDFDRWPGDGSTKCITNCRCSLEMADGAEGFSNA